MNKSKLFLLLILFAFSGLLMLLTPSARAWQVSISDCQGCGSRAEAVVVDAAGDLIVTGSFFYGSDVVKLSGATGQLMWRSEVMGHESRNYVQDMAIDSHGDVFVVFAWTRVVIKVSGADGTKIWEKPIGGTLNALLPLINAVAVDRDDNVITAGTMGGFFNVCKLDGRTGDEKWHNDARGGLAKAVAVDPFGNVAAVGIMNSNFAVMKLNGADGAELWQREIDGAGNFSNVFEEANDVAMDRDGSVVAVGSTSNIFANPRDFTVAKYTPTGDRQWFYALDGGWCETNDRGERVCQANDEAHAVSLDSAGNVIAVGTLQADGDPFIRGAVEHFRVIKFAKEGGIEWSEAAQDPPRNAEYTPGHAFAVSVDSAGDVAAGGVHAGRFTVVKFQGATGARAWPPHQINSGGLGNGNNAVAVLMDADKNVVAAGEIIGADGWQKFTVIKLRGTDGADYFAEPSPTPTPTPTVPETVIKYAPLVYLHPKEVYRPGNPPHFIQRSELGWSHQASSLGVNPLGVPCEDDFKIGRGQVSMPRLGQADASSTTLPPAYTHTPRNFDLLCGHTSVLLSTRDYTRPFDGTKRPNILGEYEVDYLKEGFYLDPEDDEELRSGLEFNSYTSSPAPVFYEYVPGRYVTYWFFYPYNQFRFRIDPNAIGLPIQEHEGDWERISIQLDSQDLPLNVFYYHHKDGMLAHWSTIDKFNGTHPIVFSARGSHASYPDAGFHKTELPIFFDHTDYGDVWSTWNNLLRVESQPWYNFGGAWGQVSKKDVISIVIPGVVNEELSGGEYTGPLGPSAYKNSRDQWLLTVSGRVTEIDGRGISGAQLTLSDAQGNVVAIKSTDANGSYFFADLTFGRTYAVVPSKEGFSFSPAAQVLRNLRENQTANFRALDTTPPVLRLPSNITVNANTSLGATVYYNVTATDDVTRNPRISCSPLAGSLFPIGTNTVACTAADDAGNQTRGTFKIIVKGAVEQITDLLALVEEFGLGRKTEHKLNHELEQAQNALLRNNSSRACREVEQFIKKVINLGRKKLEINQASALIASANRIRAVMGCR